MNPQLFRETLSIWIIALFLRVSYGAPIGALSLSYAVPLHDGTVMTLSEADARKIGAKLQHWSARPISQANVRAVGLCVVAFVMTLVAAHTSPEPIAAIRVMAVLFMASQGAVHYLTIASLRSLIALGVNQADGALATYRDPRRISCLDMAMFGTGVALIVPYLQ